MGLMHRSRLSYDHHFWGNFRGCARPFSLAASDPISGRRWPLWSYQISNQFDICRPPPRLAAKFLLTCGELRSICDLILILGGRGLWKLGITWVIPTNLRIKKTKKAFLLQQQLFLHIPQNCTSWDDKKRVYLARLRVSKEGGSLSSYLKGRSEAGKGKWYQEYFNMANNKRNDKGPFRISIAFLICQ